VIHCPQCGEKHVEDPHHPHHSHRCYHCGHAWEAGQWNYGSAIASVAVPVATHTDALDGLVAEVRRINEEAGRLRAIIAGRETAPTDAEIEAHAKDGGWWLVAGDGWSRVDRLLKPTDGQVQWCRPHRTDLHHGMTREWRWWPLEASSAPCAWPEVTP